MLGSNTTELRGPFHKPVPWAEHVDRLGVLQSAAVPDVGTADVAVARLAAAGLQCQSTSAPRLHILGGTTSFVERGVHGYGDPFAILAEQGGVTAMVAGVDGAADEEAHLEDLASAVDFVLSSYARRGRPGTPPAAH